MIENSCKEANNVVDRECVEEVSEKPHNHEKDAECGDTAILQENNTEQNLENNIAINTEQNKSANVKPSAQNNARERKALEQQNVLRRIIVSREYNKKKQRTTSIKKNLVRSQKENPSEPTSSTNVDYHPIPIDSINSSQIKVDEIKTENVENKLVLNEKVDGDRNVSIEENVVVEEKVTAVEYLPKWRLQTKGVLFCR